MYLCTKMSVRGRGSCIYTTAHIAYESQTFSQAAAVEEEVLRISLPFSGKCTKISLKCTK